MNKLLPVVVLCSCVTLGCRTRPVSPDQSWADYGRYYSPTGEQAAPTQMAAQIRTVKAKEAEATIQSFTSQGYVVLGKFLIADDTDITLRAVDALAQKLHAGAVVWTTENEIQSRAGRGNPDIGIVGVDKYEMSRINADRQDMSFAEQVITQKHTIWMLGQKTAK